ncbi:hypothetical protein QUB36_07475 [Microcoleus sp. AT8-B1]|uniref:hypothetical protein n=1 Tax=unclassified Microcoleus TaxID=2642155 RepID=UPI002FCE7AEC
MNKKRAIALWDLKWERRSHFGIRDGNADRAFGYLGERAIALLEEKGDRTFSNFT